MSAPTLAEPKHRTFSTLKGEILMFNENAMIAAPPATTLAPGLTRHELLDLINAAHEQTHIAARLAQGFDDLEDVSFADLDAIARNCNGALRRLSSLRQLLAESEVR